MSREEVILLITGTLEDHPDFALDEEDENGCAGLSFTSNFKQHQGNAGSFLCGSLRELCALGVSFRK